MNGEDLDNRRARADSLVEQIVAQQAGFLGEEDITNLRSLARLVAEVSDYAGQETHGEDETLYVCESVFARTGVFMSVCRLNGVVVDPIPRSAGPQSTSPEDLLRQHRSLLEKLQLATTIQLSLRLLVDLYKLELAFAALVYE